MFKSAGARFALRAVLVGVGAAAGYLIGTEPIGAAELQHAVLVAITSGLSYAGLGALVPAIEPNVGRKQG